MFVVILINYAKIDIFENEKCKTKKALQQPLPICFSLINY